MPNIDTTIHSYTAIRRLNDYVSKALPTVFDDSLSYYDELSKILKLLNEVIDRVEEIEEDIETLKTALDTINTFIDNLSDKFDDLDDEIENVKTRVTALENTIDTIATQAADAAAAANRAERSATAAAASASAAENAVNDIKDAFGIDDGDSGLIGDNDTPGIDGVDGNLLIDSDRGDFNTDIYNIHDNVSDITQLPFSYGYCKALFNNAWLNLTAVPILSYTAHSFEDYEYSWTQASGQPYYELTKTSSNSKKSIMIDTDVIDGSYILLMSDISTPTLAGEVTVSQYYNVTDGATSGTWYTSNNRAFNNSFAVTENVNIWSQIYNNGRVLVVLKINKQQANKKSYVVIEHDNSFNLTLYISGQSHKINDVKTNIFYPKNTKYVGYLVEDATTALGYTTLSYVNGLTCIIPRNLIAYEIFNALAADTNTIQLTINDVSSIVDMINGEVI